MNIGEIKRYVNNSQQPLNTYIGSPADTEESLTIYGKQKKY